LKLASGQASHRLKDLADVQEVILKLNLPQDYAEQLHPSLQAEYGRIWANAQTAANDDY
jgi:hypothetical protein